jgi:hypothetical protein
VTAPRSRRIANHRLVRLVALAAVLAGVSCGGDDDQDEAEPPDATPSSTTTTTSPAEGPAEWVEVAQDIYDRDFALLQDPDPAAVADLYAETCDCWADINTTVEFLVAEGEHVEGSPARVVSVAVEQVDDVNDFVDLTVQIQAEPQQRVDQDGTVVQEVPAQTEPSCVSLTLRPDGPDDAYRVHTQLALTDCPPEGSG